MEKEKREEVPSKGKKKSKRKCWKVLLLNIIGMVVLGLALMFLALQLLKVYTRHNDVLRVPDLVGISPVEAISEIGRMDLHLEVIDSTYMPSMSPGVILEITPKVGVTIKKGRTIYATVNNSMVKQLVLPDVRDVSKRQAEALLSAVGFTDVTVKYVAGSFHDLALGIRDSKDRILMPGERVAYNQPLILEVSSAEMLMDSLAMKGLEVDSLEATVPVDSSQSERAVNGNSSDGENWF